MHMCVLLALRNPVDLACLETLKAGDRGCYRMVRTGEGPGDCGANGTVP